MMGMWSEELLGGDRPLDIVGMVGRMIGFLPDDDEYDDAWYSLALPPERIAYAKHLLESHGMAIMLGGWDADDYMIIAAIYLHLGVPMPVVIREKAIKACETELVALRTHGDGWGHPDERIAVIEPHLERIKASEV